MSSEEEISQYDENENKIKNINKNENKKSVNSKNLKAFEKYHNLSIKELHILLSQKNDDLIKLNEEKEKSKKILHDLLIKLNNTISSNSEYLYNDEIDDELIYNLGKTKDEKKKQLENAKKMKNLFREQLSNIKEKLSYNEKGKNKLSLLEQKIDDLKKKNILIKKEIRNIKNKNVMQDKELEIISENIKYPLKIKIKTEEVSNFVSQKHDYFSKFSMSLKSLDNILKEIKRFDEMYNSSIKEDTDENIVKTINFWMNLIRSDLAGDTEDIVTRVEKGKSQFLNEIKNRNEANMNTNGNTNGYDTNITNSFSNAHTEESPLKITETNDIYNKKGKNAKNEIILDKNKTTRLLYTNFNNSANLMKRNKIQALYMNSNKSGNYSEHQTLFKKLNYLKVSSPNYGMKIKLKNINNSDNNYKSNNNYISEEINDSSDINNNNIDYTQPTQNQMNNQELNSILTSDYNQITDAEFRELLNKKEQYLESNMRLEKNIIEIQKTKKQKLSNVLKVIKENEINLENIKNQNHLIEREINNLCNVLQLTIEQTKLQTEIKQNNNNKKLKLKKESAKNEENKLCTSSDNIQNNKNFDDIEIPKKRKIKSIDVDNNSSKKKKKKKKKETREEKLKMIGEKYKNGLDEINEDIQIDNDNNNSNSENKIIENSNNIGGDN